MTNVMRAKKFFDGVIAKANATAVTVALKMREQRGDSNLVSVIFMIVVVIVVITVIFFPQLREMLTGVFDKSGDMLDSIWNYS